VWLCPRGGAVICRGGSQAITGLFIAPATFCGGQYAANSQSLWPYPFGGNPTMSAPLGH
jgi:hypothetical protein